MDLVLMAYALVCAILAATGVPTGRFNPVGGALAFWLASIIF